MEKIRLSKRTLTQFIRFDCDRLLKNWMVGKKGISPGKERPGIETIQEIGHLWEQEQYNQIIESIPDEKVIIYKKAHDNDGNLVIDETDLIKTLKSGGAPKLIIEASFQFLDNIFENLSSELFEFDGARPDIIWITEENGKKILNIIDIKTAAEPSLKHFSEVALYALALDRIIRHEKLDGQYDVNMETAYIWPGTYEKNLFKRLFAAHHGNSQLQALDDTLNEILIPVDLNLYYGHIRTFFEEKVPKVFNLKEEEVEWSFGKRCNLCNYMKECSEECSAKDLIDQIPNLTKGQLLSLKQAGFETISDILSGDEIRWEAAIVNNITLKPIKPSIIQRAEAIRQNKILRILDKKTLLMPSWSDRSVFIETHFDPITGLTYAIGLGQKVYDRDLKKYNFKEWVFINDKSGIGETIFDNSSEKEIFIEFLRKLNYILEEALENKETIHFYFWDSLALKQLKRMITRYIQDEEVSRQLEKLISFYAPEGSLENPEIMETIPGTIVKTTLYHTLTFPIPYDYGLIPVANVIQNETGQSFKFLVAKHFYTKMNDQIPFERAYDLWTNDVRIPNPELFKKLLQKKKKKIAKKEFQDIKYSREEVREILKKTVKLRINALSTVIGYMQIQHKDAYLLRKKLLKRFAPVQKRGVAQKLNQLFLFERLNAIARKLENDEARYQPVEEKEARFFAMRELELTDRRLFNNDINELRREESFANIPLEHFYVFKVPDSSLDAKIKEGDFLLTLSNEKNPYDTDQSQIDTNIKLKSFIEEYDPFLAKDLEQEAESFGLPMPDRISYLPIKKFFQCTLAKILHNHLNESYIIVHLNGYWGNSIQFAFDKGFLSPGLPFVLEPVFQDFNTDTYEKILKTIGKDPEESGAKKRKKGK